MATTQAPGSSYLSQCLSISTALTGYSAGAVGVLVLTGTLPIIGIAAAIALTSISFFVAGASTIYAFFADRNVTVQDPNNLGKSDGKANDQMAALQKHLADSQAECKVLKAEKDAKFTELEKT